MNVGKLLIFIQYEVYTETAEQINLDQSTNECHYDTERKKYQIKSSVLKKSQ